MSQNGTKLFLTFFLGGFFLPLQIFAQMKCEMLFKDDLVTTEMHLKQDDFTTDRVLTEYNDYFSFLGDSPDLLQTLAKLVKGALWFDMGSGKNKALVKGLEKNPQIRRGVGVSVSRSERALGDERVPGRLKQINGDMLENFVAAGRLKNQMGKVDLITDVFGPLSYSRNVVEVMQIYLNMLKTNGQAMIAFQIERGTPASVMSETQIHPYNAMITENGIDKSGLLTWLRSIPGVSVEFIKQKSFDDNGDVQHTVGVRITKLQDVVAVPNTIRVQQEVPTVPPMRIFAPVNPNDRN